MKPKPKKPPTLLDKFPALRRTLDVPSFDELLSRFEADAKAVAPADRRAGLAAEVLELVAVIRNGALADAPPMNVLRLGAVVHALGWFDHLRFGSMALSNYRKLRDGYDELRGDSDAKRDEALKLYRELKPTWAGKAAELDEEIGDRVGVSGRQVRTYRQQPRNKSVEAR